MSFMSNFAAFVIRCSGRKKLYSKEDKRREYIEGLREKNSKPFKIPPFIYKSKVDKEVFDGTEIITFNKGRERKIIYLHGGAFCEPPLLPHFMFCDKIAAKTEFEIIFPVYKKAPDFTFKDTFSLLEKLYKKLLEDNESKNIVFMGDSSGGGLALSFCECLKSLSLPQPRAMILLSPWIDVSMDTPFDTGIDSVDPNLQYDFLKLAGKNWAGDSDVHDFRVSPIYGDLKGLAPMTVYYGTHENIIVDARKFKEKCEEAGVQLDYHEWEGMNHVFVIYPIPEASLVHNEIIDLLNNYED